MPAACPAAPRTRHTCSISQRKEHASGCERAQGADSDLETVLLGPCQPGPGSDGPIEHFKVAHEVTHCASTNNHLATNLTLFLALAAPSGLLVGLTTYTWRHERPGERPQHFRWL